MNRYSTVIVTGCLALMLGLAGCSAKPRTGPFDVPSGGSGGIGSNSGYSGSSVPARQGASGSPAPTWQQNQSDAVNRAAAEIAAAKVFFDFNRAEIRPDARAALDHVAGLLKQNPSIQIGLQGHCDERGSNEYNYGLGERRARAAYGYLLRAGVPAYQLKMVNYGKKTPAVAGRTESAYAQNRRVAFCVLTTCY
ncbi:Peptidoglycan-associated lipoprotein (modular protein) [uncultured delta proteobacterium]|uniref:Peptidoglycan-associated lipoprotein n=1 Tax=uncultured delta proteobacterium TaxID=34034 RepID=A0A212JPJ8_9DELT|nr:Peptidoglycan-associated lipoprotein (modular protein) [uncultured delta proteobacterium]